MSQIVLQGDVSGSAIITTPSAAGTPTLTLPTTSGTILTTATGQTLTSPVFAGTPTGVGVLTSGTAVASTSGTSIDFTSIPSWVKRITVMLNGVSTNGTSNILVRLGNSGGIVSSGYVSQAAILSSATRSTTGFILTQEMTSGGLLYGQFICNLQNSATNAWTGNAALDKNDNNNPWSAGALTSMASALTTVRITTVNGTDTFDAGSVNILYE
jgi:hypothetical protein